MTSRRFGDTIGYMRQPQKTLRVTKLIEQGKDDDLRSTTAGERLGMMWQLTVDAWAFKGEDVAESRLSRHVVRVIRGKR